MRVGDVRVVDVRASDVAARGWALLREDVSLPVAVLRESRIEHNLRWMQSFIDRYGVKLAPHGKTTMSPALFQRQLDHGAWGITLATAPQVAAAFAHGIRRVLMANQLVGRANMAIIADLQARDDASRQESDANANADPRPAFDFCCIVDSAANVDALGAYFQDRGQRLRILIEYGVMGGRTGVRDDAQETGVLEAIRRWPDALALVGVEIYEGVLREEADIRAFLTRVRGRARRIADAHGFAVPRPILSGAGSAWYDVVAEEFTADDAARQFDVILRPGCYLTHDVGIYRQANDRIQADNPVAREMRRSLLPALQVWAYVQSVPEPGRAIIALGKRDAAFDAGFPTASLHYRPQAGRRPDTTDGAVGGARPDTVSPAPAPSDWEITAMLDQHAFLSMPADADLRVGDMIGFDISHPCLTFDKWRNLLLVDDAYRVTGAVATFF
ncbi:amino acid deaminase [Robbsia sp. Bb-Pol-6]|uniref:Amino acid deaminase n=1 Tax=Robbsia betulipollinis TaxID=2981849 RepID=A0ABT3ZQL8_9BURK|nr:amino acid deaminase [Robbsia betulipollinis]MCY0388851.1 amino acid deaminase [Robbsia betulipollinis]